MKIRLTCVHHEALMIDCIVHDVPFPAYETFDHRQNLPRRFFLFFDKLFRAGRHNKELWSAAITRNKGRNNISFGTCIFEAHVRTTIQENYFAWMYQALANPKIIQILEKADDFKTEYDYDVLPDELACSCPLISHFPSSCEFRYNTARKGFEKVMITEQTEMEAVQLVQRQYLQNIVDKNKEKRRETLKILRTMVDDVRPRFQYYNREERNDFNLSAKRTFKLFLTTYKENVNETTTPPTKKRKKASPNTKKCRVSDEKLDIFKAVQIQILREKQSGLRLAWEKLYKQIVYSLVVNNADSDAATHKAEDFLLELEELDNNWRRSQLLVNNEIQELNDESLNIEEERIETI